MKRLVLIGAVCALSGVAVGSLGVVLAGQENVPGAPTIARMFVLNRARADAVPVTVHSDGDVLPVAVMSQPPIVVPSNIAVVSRASRQLWEYRQLRVSAGDDAVATLSAAGGDGWEAVAATGAGAVTIWTLKRPR